MNRSPEQKCVRTWSLRRKILEKLKTPEQNARIPAHVWKSEYLWLHGSGRPAVAAEAFSLSDGYSGRRQGRGRRSLDDYEDSEPEELTRVFVALFDYDPMSMSPNPDAADEELPFKEGQIIKVVESF